LFAYADDLTLLAPTPRAMRLLLHICDEYGKKFSVKFNATKSAWLFVTKRKLSFAATPQFSVGGEVINQVSEFTHLGHIISDKLDDKGEISGKRNNLCGKINNVLCYFRSQHPLIKLKLFRMYCSDFYGSLIWDWHTPQLRMCALPGAKV